MSGEEAMHVEENHSGSESGQNEKPLLKFLTSLSIEEDDAREYLKLFEENHIDETLILELKDDDLEKIGIRSLGHRKLILRGINSTVKEQQKTVPRVHPKQTLKAEKREHEILYKTGKKQLALQKAQSKDSYKLALKQTKYQKKAAKWKSPLVHPNEELKGDEARELSGSRGGESPNPLRWSDQKKEHKRLFKQQREAVKMQRRENEYARDLAKQQRKLQYKQQKLGSPAYFAQM